MVSNPEVLISIGRITSTHGIRGEVRVYPLTDYPERFKRLNEVIINHYGELSRCKIESVRPYKQMLLLKFVGIDDLDQAERLKNALVQIPEDEVMPLAEGVYYIYQIVGLSVYTVDDVYLGQVKDVLSTGSNDIYQVIHENGKEYLIPALRKVVEKIDLQDKRITIRPMPGLLEL